MKETHHDLTVSTATTLNNQINPLGLCAPINKNTKYVSGSRVIHISFTLPKKSQHVLIFISEGILDQISIALHFIILAPDFDVLLADCSSFFQVYHH